MIIVCPECSTKFNISPDKIPDQHAKVRCARCKHVFAVSKEEAAADNSEKGPEDFVYERFQDQDKQPEAMALASELSEEFSFGEDDGFPEASAGEEQAEPVFEEPADDIQVTEQKEEQETYPPPARKQKQGSSLGSLIRILLLVILAVAIALGTFVYINGADKLNEIIQQVIGQSLEQTEQEGQISLSKLEGKFIKNEQAGELFLIRGEAVNGYQHPRSAVQVKGIIFDQAGKPLLQKTVFCGNPISDEELMSMSFEEVEKRMNNQFGNHMSNMKLDMGATLPFAIVFKDLPGNLSEFSVNVTSSKPATN